MSVDSQLQGVFRQSVSRRTFAAAVGTASFFKGATAQSVRPGSPQSHFVTVSLAGGEGYVGARIADLLLLNILKSVSEIAQQPISRDVGTVTRFFAGPGGIPIEYHERGPHFVVRGRVLSIAGRTIINSSLISRNVLPPPAEWKLESGRVRVVLGLPISEFRFEAIEVLPATVDRYKDEPGTLIFGTPAKRDVVGTLGREVQIWTYSPSANWGSTTDTGVWITSDGIDGWVELPKFSEEPVDVTEFSAALLQFMSGDPAAALRSFDSFLKLDVRQSLRIQSMLLRGRCEEALGQSGLSYFLQAFELNPFRRESVQHILMAEAARALVRREVSISTMMDRIDSAVRIGRRALPASDPWLENFMSQIRRPG